VDLEGGQGVVVVHDDMNQQVDADWHPLDRGVLVELYPAQEQRGSVVILMQKDDFFLLQDEDDGVEKLVPLDEVVEVVAGTRKRLSASEALSLLELTQPTAFADAHRRENSRSR
jgi:hypothetical protein